MSYLYTIIVSVKPSDTYSADKVREGINSMLAQSVSMSEIQMIILDESSNPNVEEVCQDFQKNYPDQVTVLDGDRKLLQKDMIKGRFLLYFDPLNRWSEDALRLIAHYFDTAPEEFDVCTCQMSVDESNTEFTDTLKFKFKNGTRVSDVIEQNRYLIISLENTILRSEAVKCPAEDDLMIINRMLINNPKFGIMTNAGFHCFVHADDQLNLLDDYRILLNLSKEKYGDVIPYIQNVILYSLKSLTSDDIRKQNIKKEEMDHYFSSCKGVLTEIDENKIQSTPGLDQYQKLAIFQLLYGNDIIDYTEKTSERLMYQEHLIFNLHGGDVFDIRVLSFDQNVLVLDGFTRVFFSGQEIKIYAVDQNDKQYVPELFDYETESFHDCYNRLLIAGKRFTYRIPVKALLKVDFYVLFGDKSIRLFPRFGPDVPLKRDAKNSHYEFEGYRISTDKGQLKVEAIKDSVKQNDKRLYQHFLKAGTLVSRKGLSGWKQYRQEKHKEDLLAGRKLKTQVAFVTARSDTALLPNLKSVNDAYHGKKIVFHKKSPYSKDEMAEALDIICKSKVVVTDDYFLPLRKYGKIKGQKVVQIWHAPGAFKKFGLDGTSLFPAVDGLYHKDYDLVVVSAEEIRDVYAGAFGVDRENVKALGFPRSDAFYDTKSVEQIKKSIYEKYPVLQDKKVILYAPTFRDHGSLKKQFFKPDLDMDRLSRELKEDQIFVICPHPVMQNQIIEKAYDNIMVIRDISTTEMMFAADMLLTDYSSVIFEFSLLNKPIAFYCYDLDSYNRDFYLDYEKDLPGDVFTTQEELTAYLRKTDYLPDDKLKTFQSRYMAACDGESSKRVADAIEALLKS